MAVLGTGVNPGFAMDALPIALTGVCERVDAIRIDRVQDARIRRLPFQQKIGAGLTREQFQRKVDDGSVRHVGLAESISDDRRRARLEARSDHRRDPAEDRRPRRSRASSWPSIRATSAASSRTASATSDGEPLITLHMEAYLGAPESYDSVLIDGRRRCRSKIDGGVHGDIATASMAVNSIPKILAAAPGLRTMRDMPLPSFFGGK